MPGSSKSWHVPQRAPQSGEIGWDPAVVFRLKPMVDVDEPPGSDREQVEAARPPVSELRYRYPPLDACLRVRKVLFTEVIVVTVGFNWPCGSGELRAVEAERGRQAGEKMLAATS